MKRKQVFVRAKVRYKDRDLWVNADVLDLDQPSFNAFVLGTLFRAGAVTGIKDEALEGEYIEMRIKKELQKKYAEEKIKENE